MLIQTLDIIGVQEIKGSISEKKAEITWNITFKSGETTHKGDFFLYRNNNNSAFLTLHSQLNNNYSMSINDLFEDKDLLSRVRGYYSYSKDPKGKENGRVVLSFKNPRWNDTDTYILEIQIFKKNFSATSSSRLFCK